MKQNPFQHVAPWMSKILHAIKKDIKGDHLSVDRSFYAAHFGTRPLKKLTTEEIFSVYEAQLLEGNEELVEWVVNRWVFKHGELYRYFVEQLSHIEGNFHEIASLSEEQSEKVLEGSQQFAPLNLYLFCRLNQVVFPESVFEKLRCKAIEDENAQAKQAEEEGLEESLQLQLDRCRREAARMAEKYENKLTGLQRKYQLDTDALKKQIRSLQKRLA